MTAELKKEFEDKFVMMTGYQMILLKDEVEELLGWVEQKIDEACKNLLISMQPKLKELKDFDHKTATIIDAIQFGMDKQQNYEHYVYQKQIDRLSPSPKESV